MKEEYRAKDKQVKNSVREDQRRWMAETAERAQKAAENGRQQELYNIVKQITGKRTKQIATVKSRNGTLLKDNSKSKRKMRWKEHFKEVLNRNTPENTPQEEDLNRKELDISVEVPSILEIITALKMLKNGKAPGIDQITAEMLKADIEQTSKELQRLFKLIWESEVVPTQ